jgi:hypothetical protein
LTEVNLGTSMPDAERARRLWEMVRDAPVVGACLYHLDQSATPPTDAQGPGIYRLSSETLAALGMRDEPVTKPVEPATIRHPKARIDRFTMDVIQWRSVAAFRAHLARYVWRLTAPWARGVTLHHTVAPLPEAWRGASSMVNMALFYRDQRGWDRGPSLYAVGGSPHPMDDGIWQMTPLNERGIHAASVPEEERLAVRGW